MTIKEWAAALRSGKYEQGNQRLRTDDTFCCLGVLCDLVDPTRWSKNDPTLNESGWSWETSIFLPPVDIYDGIDGLDDSIASDLANANDRGASFEQIASALLAHDEGNDIIEALVSSGFRMEIA